MNPFIFTFLLCFGISQSLSAAGLTITPTKLDIFPAQKSAVLKLFNKKDKAVRLQVFIKAWSQDSDGKTVLSDSKNLVVYPKLLSIAAKGERPIRVGFQGDFLPTEQAFRLLIDELPEVSKKSGIGVIMPVRLSIPVFLNNSNQGSKTQFKIISAQKQGHYLRVGVHNQGSRHFMLKQVQAELFGTKHRALGEIKTAGWYVLAQGKIFFNLKWTNTLCKQVQQLKLKAVLKNQTQLAEFDQLSGSCAIK